MPTGGVLHQGTSKGIIEGFNLVLADGTSWMAFYCLYMMKIAMELAIKLHKVSPCIFWNLFAVVL